MSFKLGLDYYALYLVTQGVPKPKTFLYDTLFTDRGNMETETITIEYKNGHRLLAPMVDRYLKGEEMPKESFSGRTFKPYKIAPKKTFTANELTFERSAGENPFNGLDPESKKRKAIADTFVEQIDQISRRYEVMAAEVLYDLSLTSIGYGTNDKVTYYDTSKTEHYITPTKTWDREDADIYGDLRKTIEEIKKVGGVKPSVLILDPLAAELFTKNKGILELLNVRHAHFGEIRPEVENTEGVAYIGRLNGLGLDIYEYQEYYETVTELDEKGAISRTEIKQVVPDYTGLLAPKGNIVKFAAESTIKNGLVVGQRIPWTYEDERNDTIEIGTISKPVLIPNNVKSLKVIKVK